MTSGLDGGAEGSPRIRTPDQRVRVFVSSTLNELAAERDAARTAITRLHLTPIMFELGARPHAPRELYRAYLAQSEVFVGIYWQQYGWVAPGEEVSGLEDEYLLSGDKPKLIYMKAAAERQPRLTQMLARVEADDRASYKRFGTADELAELLADDMAVLLTERFARSVPAVVLGRPPAPLPVPLTPIIGREDEIAAVAALLRDPDVHLVTLIGPGGIGKTRLAIEVARKMSTARPAGLDEVSFIDLAAVLDAAGWPEAVTAVLGIRPEGTRPVLDLLIDRLQGRRLLLVLDNVEQLVAAASDLGTLLAACPDLTVLVTSRIVLRLHGEHEVALAPLLIPSAGPRADPGDAAAPPRHRAGPVPGPGRQRGRYPGFPAGPEPDPDRRVGPRRAAFPDAEHHPCLRSGAAGRARRGRRHHCPADPLPGPCRRDGPGRSAGTGSSRGE
jgi:hypothetical protein